MALSAESKRIISDVVSIPTAPFHEHKVISFVTRFCLKNGFKLRQDEGGNILIRYKKGKAKQPVVISAHMDHPGFEVLSVKGNIAEVGVMGGVNLDYFKKAKVIISSSDKLVKGQVVQKSSKKWMGKPRFKVKVKGKVEIGNYGYYDVVNFKLKDNKIYTKAADNLIGTALLLNLLVALKKKRTSADVTVLLTRAEEVGFVGCINFADSEKVSKKVPIIVLETSNAFAGGVDINGGPVIRVGDKQSGFIPVVDSWLHQTALSAQKKRKKFKFQRALLAGGRCEASALILKDYTVGAMAFPLGNYHNNGPKTYAPEYIGVDDYNLMLEFLIELSKAPKLSDIFKAKKKDLWGNYDKWKKRL